jgi:hypothetical protein
LGWGGGPLYDDMIIWLWLESRDNVSVLFK